MLNIAPTDLKTKGKEKHIEIRGEKWVASAGGVRDLTDWLDVEESLARTILNAYGYFFGATKASNHGLLYGDENSKRLAELIFGSNLADAARGYERFERAILVRGPRGSGKERVCNLIGRSVELLSGFDGRHNRLRAINAAALSPQLLQATLFGCKKGAFTGATEREGVLGKLGADRIKNGGIPCLFIDEVGQMDKEVQAKLLRVLETGLYQPLGAEEEREIEVHFHLVCATNKTRQEEEEGGGSILADFRDRIGKTTLEIPGVASHIASFGGDSKKGRTFFEPLVERAMRDLERWSDSEKDLRLAKHIVGVLVQDAVGANPYCWPGNLREVVARVHGHLWSGEELIPPSGGRGPDVSGRTQAVDDRPFEEQLKEFERKIVERILRQHPQKNNEDRAWEYGLSRSRLEKMIKAHDLRSLAKEIKQNS